MGPTREIITDENLSPQLAGSLRKRGRDSVSVAQLDLRRSTDPQLIEALAVRGGDWILLTGDDKLPLAHADLVDTLRPTIATIDPRLNASDSMEKHRWEVVHRWAHKIAVQDAGSVRRYSTNTHRLWTPRVR